MYKNQVTLLALLMVFSIAKTQTFNLNVINGYGSGTYNEGDSVHIWSKAVFDDTVFVRWAGQGKNYISANEWHTILTVPQGSNIGTLNLQAKYDIYPAATQTGTTGYLLYGEDSTGIQNVFKETYFTMPPQPKGVVFLLHGTNGSGKSFFKKFERFNIVKDLVYNDFAVFTLDANETTMGDQNGDSNLRWITANAWFADESNNIDIKNVLGLKDSIIRDFNLSPNIPCFSFGMSNGSNFSDICASALNFNASAHMTAKGKPDTYTRPDVVPVIWIMAENDHNESADNAVAYFNYQKLALSQTTEWHLFKRSTVYPERFLRSLNNITGTQSDAVFQKLKNNGYLDNKNYLAGLDVSLLPFNLLDNLGLTANQKFDIRQQLLVVNADHIMHSDFNQAIIRFFNQTITPLSVVEPDSGSQGVSVYPNPLHSSAIISFDNFENRSFAFRLFDLKGKVAMNLTKMTGNQITINRNNLQNGMYIFQITTGDEVKTGKLILE
jgi:poly(3-hydroxybutyrate) depolymerase